MPRLSLMHRLPLLALTLTLGALLAPGAQAADDHHHAHDAHDAHHAHAPAMPASASLSAASASGPTAQALHLEAAPAPLAARFAVTVTPAAGAQGSSPRQAQWYFVRTAQRIALLKGAIDEVWHRDAKGRISFERVFHDDQRAVDYTTGELITLDVHVNWAELATFINPQELLALQVVATQGQGASERVQLRGTLGTETLEAEWLPALQLPARLTRTGKNGAITRIELQQHAATAPADWPVPGVRSANYVRLDAADFGDMEYDPVVKKAEALDMRLGWRKAHQH